MCSKFVVSEEYITKARELVESIPNVKKEIDILSTEAKNSLVENKAKILKRIKVKIVFLQHMAEALQETGTRGLVLVDTYFNDSTLKSTAERYDINIRTVSRCKHIEDCNERFWEDLAILLYGVDALKIEDF